MTSLQPRDAPSASTPVVRLGSPDGASRFEAIYREHFRFAWRTVRRLGIEGSSVDDVVQEVFLIVHRRLAEFEDRSSHRTWLFGIIRRVIADHRRTLRRKPAWAEESPGQVDALPAAESKAPDASAEQAEKVRLLHRLLRALDDEKREVFILAELEGMTLAEIAEALEVNANTVASRLRAARQRFDAALAEETARSPEVKTP